MPTITRDNTAQTGIATLSHRALHDDVYSMGPPGEVRDRKRPIGALCLALRPVSHDVAATDGG